MNPILRKRIDFENFDIVYPTVPQQNNWYLYLLFPFLVWLLSYFLHGFLFVFFLFSDDCGVFTIMHLKHWTPRTPIGNMFGPADVDNIRIRLANELYFSGFNSVDKTFVTHFFDDVSLVLYAFFSFLV